MSRDYLKEKEITQLIFIESMATTRINDVHKVTQDQKGSQIVIKGKFLKKCTRFLKKIQSSVRGLFGGIRKFTQGGLPGILIELADYVLKKQVLLKS